MGRGLSELQRWILHKAAKQPRVYAAEVLVGYFNWKPKVYMLYSDDGFLSSPGNHRFDPKRIGVRRYRAVRASLSRACLRLNQRGLVTCLVGASGHWAGLEITDKGREYLSVNSSPQRGLS